MGMMNYFKWIIIIQLFYAFAITTITYSLPADTLNQVTAFSDVTGDINIETVSNDVKGSVQNSLDIPVIELGALIFYSGNILIDLMLNFWFAIPEMIGMFLFGFVRLFSIPNDVFMTVQIFFAGLFTILYFIGLLQLLMDIRGRGTVM